MITGFDHVAIVVHDWDGALAQYAALLGVAGPCEIGAADGVRSALFQLLHVRVALLSSHPALAAQAEGLAALGLRTQDAGACLAALHARGWIDARQAQQRAPHEGARVLELPRCELRGLCIRVVERPLSLSVSRRPERERFAPDQVEALDHIVVQSGDPEQARACYAGVLGLRLALDRELRGTRMLFFRSGGVTLEVVSDSSLGSVDRFFGLAFRVRDLSAAHARLAALGFALSATRPGRKPGTQVFSVRDGTCGVPTLFISDPSRA